MCVCVCTNKTVSSYHCPGPPSGCIGTVPNGGRREGLQRLAGALHFSRTQTAAKLRYQQFLYSAWARICTRLANFRTPKGSHARVT